MTPTGDVDAFAARGRSDRLSPADQGGGGRRRQGHEHRALAPANSPECRRIASSEAQRYFGDGRIYAETYVERPRHIEVQVLGDGQGNAIHLFERECSVQRRFQKIIEEAPAPNLAESLRERNLRGRRFASRRRRSTATPARSNSFSAPTVASSSWR